MIHLHHIKNVRDALLKCTGANGAIRMVRNREVMIPFNSLTRIRKHRMTVLKQQEADQARPSPGAHNHGE
jgi:hypothetical protein